MADAEPLVSVIIPTYNREAYLREAVASVFAQTYANWELIVADDGSTDGTRAYLASLHDPRVRAVPCEHSVIPARVRNAGLAQATGRYVAFLDDDDLWMPEKLALQIADLVVKPHCGWSYTYMQLAGPDGAEIPVRSDQVPEPCEGWILEPLVAGAAWVACPTVVAEASLLRSVGGFDESFLYCEDYDAWFRMAMASRIALVMQPLAIRRVHPGNTFKTRPPEEVFRDRLELYQRLLGRSIHGRVRSVARRQLAATQVVLADWLRGESRFGAAMRALLKALPRGLQLRRWWLSVLRTSLRPLVPGAAMRVYRALRRP